MKNNNHFSAILKSNIFVLVFLALVKLLIHFLFNSGYGYFRDEFYYMACGEHLAFGYVDQPPFVAIMATFTRLAFGDSLFAIRFLPAVAGAVTVFLTGLIARQLGGKRYAQILACVAVIISPIYLAIDNFLSMNPFDQLFWTLSIFLFIHILKSEKSKYWILFGLVMGIGLQNKISVLFLGFGLVIGLLLTKHRKQFITRWPWIAAAIAIGIFLPHIIWQISNGFPTLEFMRNASLYKNVSLSPLEFINGQLLEVHPLSFPILLTGLYFFLISKDGKPFRMIGWAYLAIFIIFIFTNAKTYYFAPIYPTMLAGGAISLEKFMSKPKLVWTQFVVIVLLVAGGILTAPMVLPVLPVEKYIAYEKKLGLSPQKMENHDMGPLPQHYADMFGWKELVETVAEVYNELSTEEKSVCGIFCQNYGEAGAIDFFGKKYGLPRAICNHNNYWIWGPLNYTGKLLIVLNGNRENLKNQFEEVIQKTIFKHPYVMPYENNMPIFLCRNMKEPLIDFWQHIKSYN